ncbi:MAG: hypothetical protein R2754_04525 [Microthrixaceae bacterium]
MLIADTAAGAGTVHSRWRRAIRVAEGLRQHVERSMLLQVLALFALLRVTYGWWFPGADRSLYESTLLLPTASLSVGLIWMGVGFAALSMAAERAPRLRRRWRSPATWAGLACDEGLDVRFIVLPAVGVLAFAHSSFEYNFALDHTHLISRLAVLVLAVLVVYRPAFLPAFVAAVLVIVGQFSATGLGASVSIDKRPLHDLLIAAAIFVMASAFVRLRTSALVVLTFCLQASHYLGPGITKLRVGDTPWQWALHNSTHHLFVAAHANGWLTGVADRTILDAAQLFARFDVPVQVATVVVELGAVMVFARRRVQLLLLGSFAVLHLSIVATSGIFFWKWIVIDLAFIGFALLHGRTEAWSRLFTRTNAAAAAVVVVLAVVVFPRPSLGWFDSELSEVFEVELVDAEGQGHSVDAGFFAPYSAIFAQNRLAYLSREPVLTGTYGAVRDLEHARRIHEAGSPAGIRRLQETHGVVRFDRARAEAFDQFMAGYVSALNRREGDRRVAPFVVSAPHHIYDSADGGGDLRLPIRTVRVRLVETYYHNGRLEPVDDKVVRRVEIPETSG